MRLLWILRLPHSLHASFQPKRRKGGWEVVLLLMGMWMLLGGCNSLFFQPDSRTYYQPHQFGLWHEEVNFRSEDGTRLHGWFLPARGAPKGTIVHFHGNAANISNHILSVSWLPAHGYNVFMFDYRGYGDSEGDPERGGAIADGVAALAYVRGRKEVDPKRLVVWGQSLGGALAVASLTRAGSEGVGLLILEASFASYREVVRGIMDRSWITWIFQYPVSNFFISDAFAPLEDLPELAHVPLLVIHAEGDPTVPFENGKMLYAAFPGPDKAFWAIPSTVHIGLFTGGGGTQGNRLLEYLEHKLGPLPPPGTRFRSQSPPPPARR